MSTEAALVAAIRASPDDDVPRLVYADWLEENGQTERAEFIRVQCEARRVGRDSPNYITLLRRSDELCGQYGVDWFGPLNDERYFFRIITERGFVDSVVISADNFTDYAGLILEHAPLLKGIHLREAGDWKAFFATFELQGIRSLSFADGVCTRDAAEELARSKYLQNLLELELDRQPLGPDGMAAVAHASLANLVKLSASDCGIGDDGVAALVARDGFRTLRELDLSENGLTDEACFAMAETSTFGQLERLLLCRNLISAAGITALANASHLRRLRELNLYLNPLGPDGGRAILASRYWGVLTELNLIGCGVGVTVVKDLRWVHGDAAVKA